MNPPLRTQKDIAAILDGLRDGAVDVIATDHAPHSFDEKQVEFQSAPFGIVGLETAMGLAMTELVHKGVITIHRMIELMSVNPRKILGLTPVTIVQGEEANLTLFDPDETWTVRPTSFHSLSKNSPFGGYVLTGRPFGIVNNRYAAWITARPS
jgi:dihydroorotase